MEIIERATVDPKFAVTENFVSPAFRLVGSISKHYKATLYKHRVTSSMIPMRAELIGRGLNPSIMIRYKQVDR